MSTTSRVNETVFVIGLFCFCGIAEFAAAQSSLNILGSSHYSVDQIQIKEAKRTEDGKVKITFGAMAETLYFCPGANGTATKEGIELTFVRSSTDRIVQSFKGKPTVKYPATVIPNTATRFIVVDAKNQPLFLKSGKQLIKIFSAPAAQPSEETISAKKDVTERTIELQKITMLSSMQLYTQFALVRNMLEGDWDEKLFEQFSFYDGMNLQMMHSYEEKLRGDKTWGPFLKMKNSLHKSVYDDLEPLIRKKRKNEKLTAAELETLKVLNKLIFDKLIK